MRIAQDKRFYRQLFLLTFPIILQHLLRISVDTVNSIMLGSIDQIQMSAVSQANQVFFVFYTICSGFSVGCCVLVAQYWGKEDKASVTDVMAIALRSAAIMGLIIGTLVTLFPTFFMRIYASDPGIIQYGSAYLRKVAMMYMPCALSVMIFGAARGVGKTSLVLYTNIVSYGVNIFLDYALLYGKFGFPQMGIDGIALGIVVARYVELALAAFFFLKTEGIPFMLKDIKRGNNTLRKDFFKVVFPIVAHEIVWSLGTSSGSMITGQLGKDAVAGYNVTMVLYDLCGSVGNGLCHASSVVIGQAIGRGDLDEVKIQARTIILVGLSAGICLGLITYSVRGAFLSLYALDPAAIAYAKQFMTVTSCIWPFSMLEITGMIAILRAGGDAKTGFYTDIVVMWMICIPLASYCAFTLHLAPWIVITIIKFIIVLEALVGLWRVHSYKWIHNLTHN